MAIFNLTAGADNSYKELIAQAKNYVAVSTAMNGQTFSGFLKKAIQKYIYATINREFYVYVDGHVGDYPEDLIDMIRRSVFNLAFSSYAAVGNLQLSNVGFTEAETSTQKPARLELIAAFRNETFDTGIKELDEILFFIETQLLIQQEAGKYSLFSASVENAKLSELLIATATEFSGYYPINESRVVFNALRQDLKSLEKSKIKALLHDDLYELVVANEDENAVFLNENYIKPALAHLAIARGVQKLTAILGLHGTIAIFDNTGNNYARTYKTAPMDILKSYKEAAAEQGEQYLTEMLEYVKANPDLFESYPHDVPIDFDDDDSHVLHNHPRLFVL